MMRDWGDDIMYRSNRGGGPIAPSLLKSPPTEQRVSHVLFFFSSRRRHTRFDCDWSSDVCSSDLPADILACHARSPRSEIHAQENPAARSEGPRQNGASPRPRKEAAPSEPNTSEWDARWRFFPEARAYPNWNSAARDDPAHQRFQA